MAKELETSETNRDERLRTRYYKDSATRINEFVKKYLTSKGGKVVSDDPNYGEIFVTSPNFNYTIKIFQFSVSEVAVDLFITSDFLFDFGKTKRELVSFFDELNKNFNFIGTGLHA